MDITQEQLNQGYNTCDKCGNIELSEQLVWITAEDFTPFEGEKLAPETYKKYDALCENCYAEELL